MSGKIVDDTRLARFWTKAKAYVDNLFSTKVKTNVPANAVFTDTRYSAGTNVQISSANVISATDTKYSAATTSAAGLMAAADKVAVNKIGTGTLNTTNKNCIAAINELNSLIVTGDVNTYTTASVTASTSYSSQTATFTTSASPVNKGFILLPTNLATFNSSSKYINSGAGYVVAPYSLGSGSIEGVFCVGGNYSSSQALGSQVTSNLGATYTYSGSKVTCSDTDGHFMSYGSGATLAYTAYIPTKYPVTVVQQSYSEYGESDSWSIQLARKPLVYVLALMGVSIYRTYYSENGIIIGDGSNCVFYSVYRYASDRVYFNYVASLSTEWISSSNTFRINVPCAWDEGTKSTLIYI